MTRASARHILVSSEEQCLALKEEIQNGRDFAEVAKEHSSCPSNDEVGQVHGPVKTQFGYHLLEITERT